MRIYLITNANWSYLYLKLANNIVQTLTFKSTNFYHLDLVSKDYIQL